MTYILCCCYHRQTLQTPLKAFPRLAVVVLNQGDLGQQVVARAQLAHVIFIHSDRGNAVI